MLLEIDEDILDLMIEEIKQMHRWMILEEVYYKEQQVMDENIVEHLKEKKYEDYFNPLPPVAIPENPVIK
jgi:hypothetical protein